METIKKYNFLNTVFIITGIFFDVILFGGIALYALGLFEGNALLISMVIALYILFYLIVVASLVLIGFRWKDHCKKTSYWVGLVLNAVYFVSPLFLLLFMIVSGIMRFFDFFDPNRFGM